jgi:hypothetical protein
MYACIHRTEEDFSKRCALSVIRAAFFLTHPHPQRKETGAPAVRLRPEEGHALLYRGRCLSLG